ncbi:MAG: GAF domain-containing protein [Anaerolineae bacterium]|nr:GAF domain-containing protein [Anaerolineae bacterium]
MQNSQAQTNEQNLLYQVSRRLNQDLDINRVLADVLRLTLDCVGAEIGSIIIFDDRGLVAHKILARQKMPAEKADLVIAEVLDQGLAGWVSRHRQGAIIADVLHDSRWINFADDNFVGGAAIGVPLVRRDRLVGVLTLRHTQAGKFNDSHLALLSSVAEQSAIAIENARLFYTVQAEQARLKAIIDGASDAIVVTDADGVVLMMNALARKAFDVPELLPSERCHLSQVFNNPNLLALWEGCKANEQPCVRELVLDNGTVFESGITSAPGVGFVIVMHDVTYLKELNELRNDFISTISHDLRSPLQLIYTYTSLLLDEESVTQRQIEFLDGINRSAKKMSDLLDDLFDLVRVNAGVGMQAERCGVGPLIEQTVARFEQMAAEKGLMIESQIDTALPAVHVNPRRIDQVLSNLLDNAIKYTPQGSIAIEATSDGAQVYVQVTDTGIGLKPEEQQQLFVKFYRARNELTKGIDGTGLGLTIAKSIVEQYGGRMWVLSTWQKGSTFGFALPLGE